MEIFNKKKEQIPEVVKTDENEKLEEAEVISSEGEPEDEDDDYSEIEAEEFDKDEAPEPMKPEDIPKVSKEQLWLKLSSLVRKLNDAEQQLFQKRIWWKSQTNMTGIMTINEILDIAEVLKIQIKEVGKILIEGFNIEDNKVNDKIKEFAAGLKLYDYWTVKEKKA